MVEHLLGKHESLLHTTKKKKSHFILYVICIYVTTRLIFLHGLLFCEHLLHVSPLMQEFYRHEF
jgi:hypothetical protein